MNYKKALMGLLTVTAISTSALADSHTLYREPTVSKDHIVFSYAGDLWRVNRAGGEAERLTTGVGIESTPFFSPDGSKVAFTGEYDGNTDVYVIDTNGGTPKRLTYHPGADVIRGWSRDGKDVLFSSGRNSYANFVRLFTVSAENVELPAQLPLPSAEKGSFSPNSDYLAYEPLSQWQQAWKRYRGGQQDKIWIAKLADSSTEKVPSEASVDKNPMWVGDKVYFISDRDSKLGDFRLFVYDTKRKSVKQALTQKGMDIKSASAGPDGIIAFEQFGTIHLFDTKTGKASKVDITLNADVTAVRPRYTNVSNRIANAHISPSGKRAVFEARGEILTVPEKKGDVRNITRTTGAMERDPAWSPDGQSIAYLSEATGEYALHIRDQKGEKDERIIKLPPMFYRSPIWSPDSKKITLTDHGNILWYIDISADVPEAVKVDKNIISSFDTMAPSWAPESDWITYSKQLPNLLRAVFVYSLDSGEIHQITDGMSDARHPTFDKNGKYLYFTASTNIGETISFADMSGLGRQTTRSVYAAVLSKDTKSPLAAESDDEPAVKKEEKPKAEKPADKGDEKEADKPKEKPKKALKIDLEDIQNRIIALPAADTTWIGLVAGAKGELFALESNTGRAGPATLSLYKFDGKSKKFSKVTDGLTSFDVSSNGKKALVRRGRSNWSIVATAALAKPGKPIKTSQMEVFVEPEVEWKQMFHEVWRGERDFFYDKNLHGLDLDWAVSTYKPYLDNVRHRSDLSYLFTEMLGQLTIGHMFIGGGDQVRAARVAGGLLGADYEIENGRYRITKIYNGENWSPRLVAPLNEPGLNIKVGDYILAVNGRDLTAEQNIFHAFEATSGKQTRVKISPNPDGTDAREITVKPINNERGIRNIDWVEGNRRKVGELSGGKLAYIYMPNTAGPGFRSFNRYFYAQTDKKGAVLDERFNGGGLLADYVTQVFKKERLANMFYRHGDINVPVPAGAIYGPKAMIINEMAGSGGDAMPWFFKKSGAGKLFGKRTWGGLVAAQSLPPLMDGGTVRAPDFAIFGNEGEWEIENYGTGPDVEVEWDPALWRKGRDPQLEATVEYLLNELKKNPVKEPKTPQFPNYFGK
ncbi:PD40 domain-containing protein [Kordiimonas sp. SCSIO 12603]|uniref:S41 family peptidase n=1 Tax=Kordiimonas sp. SCSIO 12603 TaxID=2829596 RepID=UPI002102C41A|nr:S41 family peptidase [Kordiimonas sp. SCSIO 12603]UTW57839.1 PD40 domain-containing protein [Kordiimonas sp. SCSIO 12603]